MRWKLPLGCAAVATALAIVGGATAYPRLRARGLYSEAHRAGRSADPTPAIAKLDEALSLDPTHAEARLLRGFLRRRLGDLEGALTDLDRVVELVPAQANAWRERGAARLEAGDEEGAAADLDRALALAPGDASAWRHRGELLRRLGDLEGALAALTRAIELAPTEVMAYRARRDLRMELDDYPSALDDATRAVELASSADDLWRRGMILETLGRFEDALDDHDRSLELSPGNRGALLLRPSCLTRLGRHDEAIDALDLLVARTGEPYPKVALARALVARGRPADLIEARELLAAVVPDARYGDDALAERVTLHVRLGDLEAALEDAEAWTRRTPGRAAAWVALGDVLERLERHHDALRAFDRAFELAPTSGGICARRASALLCLGQAEAALEASDLAARLSPQLELTYATRVKILARRQDLRGVLADAERLHAISEDPAARLELALGNGWVCIALGRLDEAHEWATRMLAHDPVEPRAMALLAMVRLRRGDADAALAAFDEAVQADPASAMVRAQRALARLEAGDLERSLEDADEALRLDPALRIARLARAGIRRLRGDLEGSLADADAAVASDPDDANALATRAEALLMVGRLAEAEHDLDRARAVAPHASTAHLARAELHLLRGEHSLAAREATLAIEAQPTTIGGYLVRARAVAVEDPAAALADLERLLGLAPRHPLAREARQLLREVAPPDATTPRR